MVTPVSLPLCHLIEQLIQNVVQAQIHCTWIDLDRTKATELYRKLFYFADNLDYCCNKFTFLPKYFSQLDNIFKLGYYCVSREVDRVSRSMSTCQVIRKWI